MTQTPLPHPDKTISIAFDRPKAPKETAAHEPDAVPPEIEFERAKINSLMPIRYQRGRRLKSRDTALVSG